jgi:hypothetical protein
MPRVEEEQSVNGDGYPYTELSSTLFFSSSRNQLPVACHLAARRSSFTHSSRATRRAPLAARHSLPIALRSRLHQFIRYLEPYLPYHNFP